MEEDLSVSLTVVYFDQYLGAARSKRGLKYHFSIFLQETDAKLMKNALFPNAGRYKNASLAP